MGLKTKLTEAWRDQHPLLFIPLSIVVHVVGFSLLGFDWLAVVIFGAIALAAYDFSKWMVE
ncbi:hypothetical protein VPHK469_0126 [Vibrio phage K469]